MDTFTSGRALGTALLLATLTGLADSSFEVYGFAMVTIMAMTAVPGLASIQFFQRQSALRRESF